MKILIVEDETAAVDNLKALLNEIDPVISIAGSTESVRQTVRWLKTNQLPDLILMDIHLSDGSAFSIFESIDLEVPVIFTTAYDDYALEAFKVNSIDYLLKPVKAEDMRRALDKFKRWTHQDITKYLEQLSNLKRSPRYRDKILIPVRDQLQPVAVREVSYFYTTDKNTSVCLRNGRSYPYPGTLDQVEESLNPSEFIRANKQFVISRNSVKNITIWFDNRLLISLHTDTPERIYVSKNKAAEFKSWMVSERR